MNQIQLRNDDHDGDDGDGDVSHDYRSVADGDGHEKFFDDGDDAHDHDDHGGGNVFYHDVSFLSLTADIWGTHQLI